MTKYLAQLNVGRLRHPVDDPRVADFVNNLDLVNGIAERSPGFVWRLKDDSGNATSIKVSDDPLFIINMSVWRSVEDLERFVFQTVHHRFYARRKEWFEVMGTQYVVMWWVDPGHVPSIEEAMDRLKSLQTNGPSADAFGWKELRDARLWQASRCAAE